MRPVHGAHLLVNNGFLNGQRNPARRTKIVVGCARFDAAHAYTGTTAVSATNGNRRSFFQTSCQSGFFGDNAQDFCRVGCMWKQTFVDLSRFDDLTAPFEVIKVEGVGTRCVGKIGGKFAG